MSALSIEKRLADRVPLVMEGYDELMKKLLATLRIVVVIDAAASALPPALR